MRLSITSMNVGGVLVNDPEELKACVGMSIYRTNATAFPLPPNSFSIVNMKNAAVSTNDGNYTWNISAAVSKKQKLAHGIYILVPSTFDPGCFANFDASLYCAGNMMQVAPYQHNS